MEKHFKEITIEIGIPNKFLKNMFQKFKFFVFFC